MGDFELWFIFIHFNEMNDEIRSGQQSQNIKWWAGDAMIFVCLFTYEQRGHASNRSTNLILQ